jgi:hypothetical protein
MRRNFLRKIKYLLLAGATLLLLGGSAGAQVPRCAPHAGMVGILNRTFSEDVQGYGLIGPRVILEVFASEQGGWTIILTGSDGVSCVLAVGLGWENVPQSASDPDRKGPDAAPPEPSPDPAEVGNPT